MLRERLIFRHPGVELADELASGVQLRDGERVSILPPSINPKTAERYEWRDAPDEVPIPCPRVGSSELADLLPRAPKTGLEWWRLAGVEDGSVSGGEGRKRAACRIAGNLLPRTSTITWRSSS